MFRLGREFELTAAVSLSKPVTLEAGVTLFDSAGAAYADATRPWLIFAYRN